MGTQLSQPSRHTHVDASMCPLSTNPVVSQRDLSSEVLKQDGGSILLHGYADRLMQQKGMHGLGLGLTLEA